MKTLIDLHHRLSAKYPIIYVVTHEEGRFLDGFRKLVGQSQDRRFYTWSSTEGMVETVFHMENDKLSVEMKTMPETEDLLEALKKVKKSALENIEKRRARDPEAYADAIAKKAKGQKVSDAFIEDKRVIVLKDAHPFLDYPMVRRMLRDLAETLPSTDGTSIVLLSPDLHLPPDLEKVVSVVDFPLPDGDEMLMLVKGMAKRNVHRISKTHTAEQLAKVSSALLGLTYDEATNILAKSISEHSAFLVKEITEEKKQILRKVGLEFRESGIRLSELGGMDLLKEYIYKVKKGFTDSKAEEFGIKLRGLVLMGPPGTGKSAVSEAIAAELDVPLVIFSFGQLKGGLVGQTENNVRNALKRIGSIGTCVVRFDEFEKMFSGMTGQSTDSGTTQAAGGEIFTEMQDRKHLKKAYLVATLNRLFNQDGSPTIPPESIRKGRWDETWFIDLPNEQQRKEIFAIHLAKRKRDPMAFDLNKLAEATDGFSGAEIETSITDGLLDAFFENRDVRTSDLMKVASGTSPLSITMKEEIQRIRDWVVKDKRAKPASPEKKQGGLTSLSREL